MKRFLLMGVALVLASCSPSGDDVEVIIEAEFSGPPMPSAPN